MPAVVQAQSLELRVAAGPTLVDRGVSGAVGAGIAGLGPLSLLAGLERTHLQTRVEDDGRGGIATFRGGTVTLGTAEAHLALPRLGRFTTYLLGGYAAGRSRPNVNTVFPRPVVNDVRALFAGGGVAFGRGPHWRGFVEGRVVGGDEAGELLVAIPLRAGIAWRW